MSMAEALLGELDYELQTTRKHLERVPANQMDWTPHEKSMTMGRLASHLAEVPMWVASVIGENEFDVAPPGGPPYQSPTWGSPAEILKAFDEAAQNAKKMLAAASDASFMETWTFKSGGETHFSMPRIAVFRSFIMGHLIHHRGQMSVYLRLTGAKVPQTYGPTADETM